jgi:2-C-methyl-D-erythritol 2,4-cyclodiphosphate synthase
MRAGIGFDAHRLIEGRKLILGGVEIPYEKGLLGHSDADVLSHAINDALLGAAALGDIGIHFPDTDMRYKDVSSLFLTKKVADILERSGFSIVNIDSVICAQRPKLAPYIEQMRKNIAKSLNVHVEKVSVKATTTEGMGYEGRGEGISAHAICLITNNSM